MGGRARRWRSHRGRQGAGGRGEEGPRRFHAVHGALRRAERRVQGEHPARRVLRPRVIEAGSTFGWGKYVGNTGVSVGVDDFGASAPANILYEKYGITADAVVQAVKGQM